MPSNVASMQLIGINSRIKAVTKLLDIESNDVRMVGITGLGGIGKTTIAKAIYNGFSNHFKAKSFVENVREWSKTEEGKIHLQEALLKGISEDKNLRVSTVYEGTTRINRILCQKMVFIILDDVDDADQIETLLGRCEGFAFRSRIILTTRNKRLLAMLANRNGLSTYDYEVEELDKDEAIELFRKHAFPSKEVPEDYLELEKQAISYAKGLPLALKVMGRDLCERPIHEWEDALDCYETNPLEDIQNILKRSYEGLNENEKNIFLDIACFFKEYDDMSYNMMSYNMIKDVLKACGLNPVYGIRNLIDKCLLTIDQGNHYLSMHDLLLQMGRDIVRQEAPQNPRDRSRLWRYEEALDVLTKDMVSDKIRSIILWPSKSEPVEVQIKAQFSKMKNLRLLLIRNVRFCNGPLECLPNGLRLLDWRDFPFYLCPPSFFPEKLVVLNLPFILLKEPVVKQTLEYVTHVDFSWCKLITKISDLSMTPNVTNLILRWCPNLVEIDDSVGRLDKLKVWDLEYCGKLETLPNCLTMKSLTSFDLTGCTRLKKFPNILHEMKGVEDLDLYGNFTKELPPSFGNLIGLKRLDVKRYPGEAHLPGSIYNLQHIEALGFYGNFIFPKNVEIDGQPACNSLRCSSKYVFPMLKQLRLSGIEIHEIEFILNYCCPFTLEELGIYDSKVVTLPESMSRYERLHTLIILGCKELREIPRLPHSIRRVEVRDCNSLDLQSFSQLLPEIIGLPLNLPPCVISDMLMFPHSSTMLPIGSTIEGTEDRLCEYRFVVTGDENDIPNWFNHQRDGNLISFWIGPEFPIIALCIAFGTNYMGYDVFVSINNSEQTFERNLRNAIYHRPQSSGHLVFCHRPQSSLQELFRDLQLTDRNHVQILCKAFDLFGDPDPIVKKIGVHVECNCLSLQSGLGLPMDTENGSDLGLAIDSSNVDGFDLGSSSVAQPVTPQAKKKKSKKEKKKKKKKKSDGLICLNN
ncbi:hypothetical protein ACB092_11G263500 [Castanea dentata]